MTESKWIDFVEQPAKGITKIFKIIPKEQAFTDGSDIGEIRWYSAWRQYCFYSKANCIFETQCLGDIRRFLDALMLERKIKKQEAKQ